MVRGNTSGPSGNRLPDNGGKKLHIEGVGCLFCSPNIVLVMRYAGHVARMAEKRNAYRVLVVKPEKKNKSLGRP
jgi:hypothetical protein